MLPGPSRARAVTLCGDEQMFLSTNNWVQVQIHKYSIQSSWYKIVLYSKTIPIHLVKLLEKYFKTLLLYLSI